MPDPITPDAEEAESPTFGSEDSQDGFSAGAALPSPVIDEIEDPSIGEIFDVPVPMDAAQEKSIVQYLHDNLPKMRPPDRERDKILGFLAMYEMTARKKNFPYEQAPSLASSDAHDKANEFMDMVETAFLQQRTTFTIDREETSLPEDSIVRMERTYHRRFFQKVMEQDIRSIFFEASFLGCSVVAAREEYEIISSRERIVIKSQADLNDNRTYLTTAQQKSAIESLSTGGVFTGFKDSLKMVNVGPKTQRVDQTKFWYPRNTKLKSEWAIVSELEFYRKSDMLKMVELGLFKGEAVKKAIENRRDLYSRVDEDEDKSNRDKLPETVRCFSELDSNWQAEIGDIKKYGDAYEDEFAVYRVTMKYNVPTRLDPSGRIQSWIEVMYCPASDAILSASFCQDGFPYYLIQYRPVPYRALGPGIAQERYQSNALDSDLKSLYLASVEQEVGAPLIIRKDSSLWATGFRAYPGSASYTESVEHDAKFFPFPEKSRAAGQAMSMVLGSSPMANQGAGYASGRREALFTQQKQIAQKARVHTIAMDLDNVFNAAWRIHCRLARFNTPQQKVVTFVQESAPPDGGIKLYILASEMDPSIIWTSVVATISLTPDAQLQEAMQRYEFFYKNCPAAVNNPRLTMAWQNYMANPFRLDDHLREELLLKPEDLQQYQQQLGQMGGERQQGSATPATAQSPNTPFSRPPQPQQQRLPPGALPPVTPIGGRP